MRNPSRCSRTSSPRPLLGAAGLLGVIVALLLWIPPPAAAQATNPDAVSASAVAIPADLLERYLGDLSERIAAVLQSERVRLRPDAALIGDPDYDEIGGDDVIIAIRDSIRSISAPSLDIADNGDIFVAIQLEVPGPDYEIQVFRSQDHGTSWQLWGTLGDADPSSQFHEPCLHIAEGNFDRLFVAYRYNPPAALARINVSYSDPSLATAAFTTVSPMQDPAVQHGSPSICSDEEAASVFYVYLVATGSDGNGTDILFARSRFQGDPWETPYKIATLTGDNQRHYVTPEIVYGTGSEIHCVWRFLALDGTADDAVRYRRATNFAGAGIDDWDPIVYLTANNNDIKEAAPSVAASHTSSRVVVSYSVHDYSAGLQDVHFWPSFDGGVTWNPADIGTLGGIEYPYYSFTLPDGEGFVHVDGQGAYNNLGILRAPDASPLAWGDHQSFVDRRYVATTLYPINHAAAFDPAHENRVGIAWLANIEDGSPDTLLFDAEWRRDPGYPNLEPGFPMALGAGVISPPGICELDGDSESEIVFGDTDGYVHVRNHDGTSLPGWPIDIGTIPQDSPVAVGDLDGDGQDEIVCGNAAGIVYAFRADGTAVLGWPVDLGFDDSTYVSIGPLSDVSHRQVAACVGTHLVLLAADGSVMPGFPLLVAGPIRASAAIGDVNDDAKAEIVILQEKYMNVISAAGAVIGYRNFVAAGKTFSNAPTIARLAGGPGRQIIAPTEQGDVYVMNHDGTDYPGWPFSDPLGQPITSVAVTDNLGTSERELFFASRQARVHGFLYTGVEMPQYPRPTGTGWYVLAAPIIDAIADWNHEIIVPSRDTYGYAWRNTGGTVDGWPSKLPGRVNVSAASGDIDNDGNVEVVFATLTNASLVVYDLGVQVERPGQYGEHWPMYGNNPERQSCYQCWPDFVLDAPGAGSVPPRLQFAAPVPNPAAGAVALRFTLPAKGEVSLAVYDIAGRRVRDLLVGELGPGPHSVTWDGRSQHGVRMAPGIYYVRLAVGGTSAAEQIVRKVTLLR